MRMRFSVSRSTRPLRWMRPRSGCSRPAMQRSRMVLPAPDGPRMPSGSSPAAKDTSRAKFGNCFLIWTSSGMSAAHPAEAVLGARPVIEAGKQRERDRNVDGAPGEGARHLVRFDGEIDRDRDRGRAAGDIPGEHQGCAELAESAREREDRSGENAWPCERQRNLPKDAPLGGAQRPRRFKKARVDLLESRARGEIHQRKRNDSRGDHGSGPRENDGGVEFQEELTQRAVAPEKQEEQESYDRWRQHERQKKNAVDERGGGAATPLTPGCGSETRGQRDHRGRDARFERDPDRRPIHGVDQRERHREGL